MLVLLQLFFEFAKAGLFAIGGGLATLPFLYEIGENTGWYTAHDIATMIAVSESTPGPIGINMATYVGYLVKGVPGALTATIGLITPSVIIILIVAAFLKAFKDNKIVQAAFYGLRAASSGLIAAALWSVIQTSLIQTSGTIGSEGFTFSIVPLNCIFAIILLILTNIKQTKKIHPIIFLVASGIVGILLGMQY